MDFVAIDFETANAGRSSACALGLVEVRAGAIVNEQAWLIDPRQPFAGMNIGIHGITPAMVAGKPTFGELWPELEPLLHGRHIAAHNASFDMSVLRSSLDQDAIAYPSFQYYCSYLLSKAYLGDQSSYRLKALADYFGIPLRHHDALEDARASALILLKLLELAQQTDLRQLSLGKGYRAGRLYAGGYKAFSAAAQARKPAKQRTPGKPSAAADAFRTPAPVFEQLPDLFAGAPSLLLPAAPPSAPESGTALVRGQKIDIGGQLGLPRVAAHIQWAADRADAVIDAAAFVLDESGRCEQPDDCVCQGMPDNRNGSVTFTRLGGDQALIRAALDRLPASAARIALTLAVRGKDGPACAVPGIAPVRVALCDPSTGEVIARFACGDDLSAEQAVVIGELYRYKGGWRFNAVGAGYEEGAGALRQAFGPDGAGEGLAEAAAAADLSQPDEDHGR